MEILVRLLGIVVMVVGCIIMLNPEVFNIIMNFWKQGKKIYLAGALRLIFGVVFLFTARECKFPVVIYVMGALMVIGGALLFILGQQKINALFGWWEKKSPVVLRIMGFAALAIGSLILYSA